jgi:hypothetical protein
MSENSHCFTLTPSPFADWITFNKPLQSNAIAMEGATATRSVRSTETPNSAGRKASPKTIKERPKKLTISEFKNKYAKKLQEK